MRLLFFIETLRTGGKERRLIELIKVISAIPGYVCMVILLNDELHYQSQVPHNVEIKIIKRKYFKKNISIFLKFCKICSKFSPDIIHVWAYMPAFYAIPAKLLYKIPMINNQITDAPEVISIGILSHNVTFKFSDHIISNSYAGIKAYKVSNKNFSVIYNGFSFSRIANLNSPEEVRCKFGITTKNVIGMVASFSSLTDYGTYIKAGIIVLNELPDTTFVCIGDGENIEYQKAIPQGYSLNFIFLGGQTEIESIINIFDIGVLDTFTEGISNSIIENMALEKPVVATEGGGTAELVINNETGYLVPQKNEKIMAERILSLLRDRKKRFLIGQSGKQRIKTDFKLETMIDKHIEIYSRYKKV